MTTVTPKFLRTRLLPTISLAAALLFANLSHANQDPPPPVERSTPEARLLRATEAAGLPPIPSNRADIYEYYKLDFLPDGYPGRRTDEGTVPHPIYGSYLIAEYLSAYRRSGSKEMLDAACRMADVALSRMDRVGEMTVFTYRPEWKLDSTTQPYVSGLTQSHYLHQLAELHDITGIARYSEAAQSIFKSLTTSVESGGVLAKTSRGVVIEESPHSPRDIVLNGWLTAIRNIRRYEARTGSKAAQDLVNANLKTLSRLLPLYDVPALANTRYRIRGFAYVRLRFESTDGVILQDASLDIPGGSTHPVRPDYLDRWHSGFMRGVEPIADGLQVIAPQVQLNLVLSLLSAPEPNRLSMRISALSAGEVSLLIADGDYTPLTSGMPTQRWKTIETLAYPQGSSRLDFGIPIATIEKIAYPTNFKKRINGRNYNSYHFIHADSLDILARDFDNPVFDEYAHRWRAYPEQWPDHPAYQDHDIELERYQMKPRRPDPE